MLFCFRLTDGNEFLFQAKDEVSLNPHVSLFLSADTLTASYPLRRR